MGDVANKIYDLRAMATRPAILNIGLQLGFCQLELIFIVEPSLKAGHQNSYTGLYTVLYIASSNQFATNSGKSTPYV